MGKVEAWQGTNYWWWLSENLNIWFILTSIIHQMTNFSTLHKNNISTSEVCRNHICTAMMVECRVLHCTVRLDQPGGGDQTWFLLPEKLTLHWATKSRWCAESEKMKWGLISQRLYIMYWGWKQNLICLQSNSYISIQIDKSENKQQKAWKYLYF